jgi:2-oxoglutarate/2-oxoacid ferredoxin oxidoreductase subunit alpha
MITARRLAEIFRTVVMVLSDANLATGVAPFRRPKLDEGWQASSPDQSPVPPVSAPTNGTRARGCPSASFRADRVACTPSPGSPTTSAARSPTTRPATSASDMRSRKLAALQSTLLPPRCTGRPRGRSARGGVGEHEGGDRGSGRPRRAEGLRVSSLHITFLSPLQPGLTEIFRRFRKVMTVEINYSDRKGARSSPTRTGARAARLAAAVRHPGGRGLLDTRPGRAPAAGRDPQRPIRENLPGDEK